jgi:hypothetical protein
MRNILQIVTAVAIVAAASSPAFAKGGSGGGGWVNSRPLANKAAAAQAEACKLHTNKCIGFGDHYYGR